MGKRHCRKSELCAVAVGVGKRRGSARTLNIRIVLLVAVVLSLAACNTQDREYYPYAMTGLNALVYDNKTGKEYLAGSIEANYASRNAGTSQCGALASATASANHLDDWSYVCCTVTSSSNCVTKVR